ncbi:MAG: SIS domain-containing protein [Lentisphaerae bacterium]|nr:SIS domain-containing protein [Lentisphaerota bacterium]
MSGSQEAYLESVIRSARAVDSAAIDACLNTLEAAYREGRTVFVIGNGGSASNASHFAQDLAKGTSPDLEGKRFKVMSLTDNVAFITALANDIGYERVFDLQLRSFAQRGDVLVAISGSGNSPNVLRAATYAKAAGLTLVAVTGFTGGALLGMADIRLHVPLNDMCQAEAVHSILFHMIIDFLRTRFKPESAKSRPA